jgi:hypothetical protein
MPLILRTPAPLVKMNWMEKKIPTPGVEQNPARVVQTRERSCREALS